MKSRFMQQKKYYKTPLAEAFTATLPASVLNTMSAPANLGANFADPTEGINEWGKYIGIGFGNPTESGSEWGTSSPSTFGNPTESGTEWGASSPSTFGSPTESSSEWGQ